MAACWSAPPEAVSREGEDLTPPCSGVALGEMGRQGKHEHPRQDPQREGKSEGQSCWHLKSLLIGISLTQSTTSASPGLVPGNLVKRSISLQIRRKLYMDLSGRMNRGKWSPLSWKTVFNTALFQGAFLQERVYLSDHSFHAVLNITETTNTEQGHRSQSGKCQFILSKESILVTQQYGADWQSHSGETHSLENPAIFSLNNTVILHSEYLRAPHT